jgi:hypothetical protein
MNEKFEYVKVDIKDVSELRDGVHFAKVGNAYHEVDKDGDVRIVHPGQNTKGCDYLFGESAIHYGIEFYTRQPVPPKKYRLTLKQDGEYTVHDGDSLLTVYACSNVDLQKLGPPGVYTITEGYEG